MSCIRSSTHTEGDSGSEFEIRQQSSCDSLLTCDGPWERWTWERVTGIIEVFGGQVPGSSLVLDSRVLGQIVMDVEVGIWFFRGGTVGLGKCHVGCTFIGLGIMVIRVGL